MQLAELERALQVAGVRRRTAQTALAHQGSYLAAHDSLRKASAEIVELEEEIEQHVSEHGCRSALHSGAGFSDASSER
jgi:aerobic-type carbon monoxide dehydrogenase small subunit (CoxS/CutS family)